MKAGQIVLVDWHDALPKSGEVNKYRPAVVVSALRFFSGHLPFEIVVPLSSSKELAIERASLQIQPTESNGCSKPCYALSWNVQSVPHARIRPTESRIEADQLAVIRAQIAASVGALGPAYERTSRGS